MNRFVYSLDLDHTDDILVLVGVPVALFVVVLLLYCTVKRRKKRKLTSLDSHLLFSEATPDNPYNHIERAMLTATTLTVVADKWEIPHKCVRIGRMLGSGAFGYVVKGRINRSILRHRGIKEPYVADRKNMYVSVAVKLIQEEASEAKKEEFLREIRLMKGIGYHNNVISMLGCCTLHDPICLIVEHAAHGDLLSYLRNVRQRIQESKINAEYVNQEIETVGPQELLSFARQISTGMEFLSQKGFIHRDLAARNILVDKKNLVKIGDFGLTRYTYDNKVYVNRKGGRLPLKWMSIEAINELTFSSASDVWSFGVLLFEIVTLGGTPYPTIDSRELLRELKNGYRMERPENCSEEIYQIMRSCWREDTASRPSFTELRLTFDSMLEKSCGEHYVNFELDDSKLYYHLHDDLNSQNTATASISPSDIDCFGKYEGTHETDIYPDVINHVEGVCTSEELIPENKDSSLEFSEIQGTDVSTRTGSVKTSLPNSRTVTFCRDSLETVPVRKRVRLGSPHTNKKYSTIATTKLNTGIPQQCRHGSLSSKASYSPDLESLPRNSVIDCDADESSIGSLCSKCSTSSNGDDDVFYSDSSNITREEPNFPYKLSGRQKLYRHRARTAPNFTTTFLADDLQNDSGVSTSSVNDENRFFVFPSNSNRLSKSEKKDYQAETCTSSDIEVKSLSHDLGMSTDTCVWDSDEQTLDTYV